MTNKTRKWIAILLLAVFITATGCATFKKIPPGQQKKEQHDNRDKKDKK